MTKDCVNRQRSKATKPDVVGRNAARTQQAILVAATEEFSSLGLGGARIDSIAARAGINKKLLYYYYGNKEGLFKAVLEKAYGNIRKAERALHLTELEPIEAIRQIVSFTWHYYLKHPELITLINNENLHRAVHLEQSTVIKGVASPLISTLQAILDKGYSAGLFRSGVDAIQLCISIEALAFFYLSNASTLSAVFSRDLRHPKAEVQRLSHITELVLGYLLR